MTKYDGEIREKPPFFVGVYLVINGKEISNYLSECLIRKVAVRIPARSNTNKLSLKSIDN